MTLDESGLAPASPPDASAAVAHEPLAAIGLLLDGIAGRVAGQG